MDKNDANQAGVDKILEKLDEEMKAFNLLCDETNAKRDNCREILQKLSHYHDSWDPELKQLLENASMWCSTQDDFDRLDAYEMDKI